MKGIALAAAVLFAGEAMAGPTVVLTMDDLPAHGVLPAGVSRLDVAHQMTDALKAAGLPPTVGFVNGVHTVNEPASAPVLTLWHDTGNILGNHTWSHPGLSKTDTAAYEAETARNEPLLVRYAQGSDWHFFRYPFLDEGKDAAQRAEFRTYLAKAGYKIGAVTMVLDDWDYPEPYARCAARNDLVSIAKLEALYLKRVQDGYDYARALSAKAYGRDIAYIILMHIGAFQARMLPQVIALYKAKGAGFGTLEEALRDPAYAAYADPALPAPPSLEDMVRAKGETPPPSPDNHGAELQAMCR